MLNADVLNQATVWPDVPQPRFGELVGRPIVFMCAPPEQSAGGIFLTDRTSGNSRPDAGVIASAVELPVGTRVYVRPGVGLYIAHEEGWYRVTGREVFKGETKASVVSIWEHIVAIDEDGTITPSPENVMIQWDERESTFLQVTPQRETATIVKVAEGSAYQPGQRAAILDSGNWLQFGDCWIVPESDIGVVIE